MELNGLDKFKIITYQNLDTDERNVFTLLYQPLIGCDAFTLYLTLWSLIDRAKLKSPEYLHEKMYDIMHCTPRTFLAARKKLEAIGLLVAYHNEDVYLYELKTPVSAEEFIKDGSLGAYLFSRIGKTNFDDLVDLFRISRDDRDGFKNITTNFDEVFESLPKPVETKGDFISNSKPKLSINHDFEFDVFLDGLSKNFVDKRKITKTVKDKIINLSYVYSLDEITMQKVFMDSVDKMRNVDVEKLSSNASKWFNFERETVYPSDSKQDAKSEKVGYSDIPRICKTETPAGVLSILSNGGKPAVSELKVVEKLIENFELKVEVINFLLIHVIGMLEEFPSYNYFDKIAASWRRENIDSVEEAIGFIKKRQQKRQNVRPRKGKNELPKDIESDWLDDYLKNI